MTPTCVMMTCHRTVELVFILFTFGVFFASAQTAITRSPEFSKCITTCTDEKGQSLPTGYYSYCDQCDVIASCNTGRLETQKCPLGTNYFDRIAGVCVNNRSVCVNDSLITTQLTTQTTTPSTVTTTSTTGAVTAPAIITSTSTTSTTSTSTTSTTSTSTTSTTSTSTTSTTTRSTTSAEVTTPTTIRFTSPTPVPSTTVGYIPAPGGEAQSFWFAIDLYNKNSGQNVRAGALRVDTVSSEELTADKPGGPGTWYRLFGVTLVKSVCPNTKEYDSANYTICPLLGTDQFVETCNFKVRYTPQNTTSKSGMVYMMCYK